MKNMKQNQTPQKVKRHTNKPNIKDVTRKLGGDGERRRVARHARQQQRARTHVPHLHRIAPRPAPVTYTAISYYYYLPNTTADWRNLNSSPSLG